MIVEYIATIAIFMTSVNGYFLDDRIDQRGLQNTPSYDFPTVHDTYENYELTPFGNDDDDFSIPSKSKQ